MSVWKHLITFMVIYIIYHEFIFVKGFKKYSLFNIYLDELCRIMYNYNIVGFFRQEGGGNDGIHHFFCSGCYGTYSWSLYVQVVRQSYEVRQVARKEPPKSCRSRGVRLCIHMETFNYFCGLYYILRIYFCQEVNKKPESCRPQVFSFFHVW